MTFDLLILNNHLTRERPRKRGKRHWREFRLVRRDPRHFRVMCRIEQEWLKECEHILWQDRLTFWEYVEKNVHLPDGCRIVFDMQADDQALQFDSEESLSVFILQWA